MKNKTGIYAIRNAVNGKVYIGSSARSFKSRWTEHQRLLNAGQHHSRHLQGAWVKYGQDNFRFEILLICGSRDCVLYEQLLINAYCSADCQYGYNIAPIAGSCLGVQLSADTRAKMSASAKNPERYAAMHAANRAKPRSSEYFSELAKRRNQCSYPKVRKRLTITPKLRAARAKAATGKRHSEETKAKISANSGFRKRWIKKPARQQQELF